MRAGGLDQKLVLLEPKRATDRMGAETVVYTAVRTMRAERVKLAGNRSEEAGEHFPDYTAEFNIRYAHPVQENWRVQHLNDGGRLYTIVAIFPNRRKGYKVLKCERVNE